MSRSNAAVRIRDTADYLKTVSIGGGVLIVLAAICFGISVAMGSDISMTKATTLLEMLGTLFMFAAVLFGTLAGLCTIMSILVVIYIVFCSAALPFTSRESRDQAKIHKQVRADDLHKRQERTRRLDPDGRWL